MESLESERLVAQLLSEARQLIAEGMPQKALEKVLQAVVLTRGQDAVLEVLDEAKRAAQQ
eukprot:g62091.t1